MLPALPTGMARTSGARPRSSQTSNAAVFWPSRRNGLTELTRVTGWSSCSARARTIASAWSKLPSMATTRAPAASAWSSLPIAIWPFGRTTMTSMPGGRPVGRGRRRRVAGRGAHDRPGAGLGGLGDGDDHAPVLERAGRVLALDLEMQVREARSRPEASGVDERRAALAEGQRGRGVADRQEAAVALHEPRMDQSMAPHAGQSSIGYRTPLAVSQDTRRDAARPGSPDDAPAGWSRPPGRAGPAGDRHEVAQHGRRGRAPPAPGPSNADTADGLARRPRSGCGRRPCGRAAESSGSAVGRTDGRERPVGVERRRIASSRMIRPRAAGVALVGEADRR